jgi:hypothetical protein
MPKSQTAAPLELAAEAGVIVRKLPVGWVVEGPPREYGCPHRQIAGFKTLGEVMLFLSDKLAPFEPSYG